VARLIPWSKYKYELEKADKARKKASTQTETKEIRMRPATDVHDFNVKVKSAQKFIEKVGLGVWGCVWLWLWRVRVCGACGEWGVLGLGCVKWCGED
jgi:hypothetical protein